MRGKAARCALRTAQGRVDIRRNNQVNTCQALAHGHHIDVNHVSQWLASPIKSHIIARCIPGPSPQRRKHARPGIRRAGATQAHHDASYPRRDRGAHELPHSVCRCLERMALTLRDLTPAACLGGFDVRRVIHDHDLGGDGVSQGTSDDHREGPPRECVSNNGEESRAAIRHGTQRHVIPGRPSTPTLSDSGRSLESCQCAGEVIRSDEDAHTETVAAKRPVRASVRQ